MRTILMDFLTTCGVAIDIVLITSATTGKQEEG